MADRELMALMAAVISTRSRGQGVGGAPQFETMDNCVRLAAQLLNATDKYFAEQKSRPERA